MVRRETGHARTGQPVHIMAGMNSPYDEEIIAVLYEASYTGVRVEMVIRGICYLKAGMLGLSENIPVRSIVGSFLKHGHVFYFFNDTSPEVYIGNTDWIPRNLGHRARVLLPAKDEILKEKMIHILEVELEDNIKTHILQPGGSYEERDKRGRVLVNS